MQFVSQNLVRQYVALNSKKETSIISIIGLLPLIQKRHTKLASEQRSLTAIFPFGWNSGNNLVH